MFELTAEQYHHAEPLFRAARYGALAHGLAPLWGCLPENVPPYTLARRLGFEDDLLFPICFWEEGGQRL